MILTTIGTCIWSTDGGSMMASSSNSKDATISKIWKNVWCAKKIKTQIHALALAEFGFSSSYWKHLYFKYVSFTFSEGETADNSKHLSKPTIFSAPCIKWNGSSDPWTQIQLLILRLSNDRNFANPGPNNDRIDKILIQMNCNCNKTPQSLQRRYGNLRPVIII